MAKTKAKLKINQTIDEIFTFLDNGKASFMHPEIVKVNREELTDLLNDLRKNTPSEVARYAEICDQKETIISEAEEEAARIRREAKEQSSQMLTEVTEKTNEMVSENEIYLRAKKNADQVIDQAREHAEQMLADAENQARRTLSEAQAEADRIMNEADAYARDYYTGTKDYLDSMLRNMQMLVSDCISSTSSNTDRLLSSLNQVQQTVTQNLEALNQVPEQTTDEVGETQEYVEDQNTLQIDAADGTGQAES